MVIVALTLPDKGITMPSIPEFDNGQVLNVPPLGRVTKMEKDDSKREKQIEYLNSKKQICVPRLVQNRSKFRGFSIGSTVDIVSTCGHRMSDVDLQNHLLSLRHAHKCRRENCKYPSCKRMKILWQHIKTCRKRTEGKPCNVHLCLISQALLLHYWKCKEKLCKLCRPVRNTVVREVTQKRQRSWSTPCRVDSFNPSKRVRRNPFDDRTEMNDVRKMFKSLNCQCHTLETEQKTNPNPSSVSQPFILNQKKVFGSSSLDQPTNQNSLVEPQSQSFNTMKNNVKMKNDSMSQDFVEFDDSKSGMEAFHFSDITSVKDCEKKKLLGPNRINNAYDDSVPYTMEVTPLKC